MVAAATLSGAVAGGLAHLAAQALLQGLLGVETLVIAGPGDGALVAAAVAAAYALTTGWAGGGRLPAPTGARRTAVLAAAAAGGALAGAALGALDRPLVGGLINQIARQSDGAALTLGPLGRFLGEATFGPVTRLLLAAFEGAAFGLAVGLSLTRRPSLPPNLIQRSRAAQRRLTTRLPAARHPRPAASRMPRRATIKGAIVTVRRLFAIAGIFLGTSAAWAILGASLVARSGEFDSRLEREVHALWGTPQRQLAATGSIDRPGVETEVVERKDAAGQVTRSETHKDVMRPIAAQH